ncbi:MAG: hypothetical protein U5K29_12175 [Acidimicrobiales bacterium]|nr:hypothetical protein [Acidimicrobiales bacterium]
MAPRSDLCESDEIDRPLPASGQIHSARRRRWPFATPLVGALIVIVIFVAAPGFLAAPGFGPPPSGQEAEPAHREPSAWESVSATASRWSPRYGAPVVVSPNGGLHDRYRVLVSGWELGIGARVAFHVCGAGILDARHEPARHCDHGGPVSVATTSDEGAYRTRLRVPRFLHLNRGRLVDCALPPDHGHRSRCVLLARNLGTGEMALADLHFRSR